MQMKAWVTALLMVLSVPAAAADLDISKYTKVYRGNEGLEVAFVGLKPNGALIRVSGIDTEIDGVVMRYEETPEGRGGARFHTELHGERFGTFHVRKDRWQGMGYSIYLPEGPMETVHIRYDEKASKDVNSDDILTAYLKPKNQKTIKKLAAWNRPERVKKQNAWYEEEADAMRKACGTKTAVEIEWKSVTDDVLKKYSIYGYCSAPINALRRVCDSKEYQAVAKSKVKKVRCRFGEKLHVELKDDGTLVYTTEVDAANQEDFAQAFLKNKL